MRADAAAEVCARLSGYGWGSGLWTGYRGGRLWRAFLVAREQTEQHGVRSRLGGAASASEVWTERHLLCVNDKASQPWSTERLLVRFGMKSG